MKKLLLAAVAVVCAGSVLAQGTVTFNNKVTGTLTTHVYLGGSTQIVGNGSNDGPAGTQNWTGFTALSGSGYMAAILAANGSSVAESSLTFGVNPTTTTFRGGASAGAVVNATATLSQVPADAANATLEIFAWDDKGGTVTDPNVAMTDWIAGTLAAGKSGAFNVPLIGGSVNLPPFFSGGPGGLQSFNIYTVPEPSTMALAGLGAAALLIFRRRK